MAYVDSNDGGGWGTTTTPLPQVGNKVWDDGLNMYRVVTEVDPDTGQVKYDYIAPRTTGGGSAAVDHFGQPSWADTYNAGRDTVIDARNATNDEAKIAQDKRNFDYQAGRDIIGDKTAAENRAADEAYRQQQLASQAADRQAQAQASAEQAAAARYASDNNYKVGMAGAANDAERNRITERWNQEQAVIARMDDATKRLLGGQSNQTNQYAAETSRAGTMGNLALENNKFIAEQARSPRDLFSLYFMQRGITPDWDTMNKGGTPAAMTPLAPQSVMNASPFTTAAPVFGQQAQAAPAPAAAPASSPTTQVAQSFAPAPTPAPKPAAQMTTGGGGMQVIPQPPPQWSPPMDFTPSWSIPTGNGMPEQQPKNNPDVQIGDALGPPPQTWEQANAANPTFWQGRMAGGGFTTAEHVLAGDANDPNPSAGGAKPEPIWNPTGAPLMITPHPDNAGQRPMFQMPQAQMAQRANQERRPIGQAYDYRRSLDQAAGRTYAQGDSRYKQQMYQDFGHRVDPAVMAQKPWAWQPPSAQPIQRPVPPQWDATHVGLPVMPMPAMYQRFALGTQGDYEANGMGSAYMPSSTNEYLAGQELPSRLKNLVDYGAPIPPSLAANATGQVAPTLNMGSALQQRGGGVGASLQTLANQTKGETEAYRGFVEGNNGIPWADFVDWLGKPTAFLKGAQRSTAA